MKKIVLSLTLLALMFGFVFVKVYFFPSVDDKWFAFDEDRLLKAPPGLVVFRPTHFHDNVRRVIVFAPYKNNGHTIRWIMGRDLPLRVAVAVACDVNRAIVVLPNDAPNYHFDFLVTTLDSPVARLRTAIQHKLGLVAQKETRECAVLAIKVADPYLGGLAVSGPGEKPEVKFRDQELYFTHIQISGMIDSFERALDVPVVDQSGLTNYYDFYVPWGVEMDRQYAREATSQAAINKMLNKLGLTLQTVNAPVELLVVRHY